MPKRRRSQVDRYSPARRLHEVRALLNSMGGASVYDIAERMRVSVRTAIRYVQALDAAGEPVYEEFVGRRKVWRLKASARDNAVTLSTSQMVALFLSRRVFDFLAGTGFKEDLDDVFARLEATLRRKDAAAARNLDRKIFDVNEAPHIYVGRLDDVNDIITALLREERLRIRHDSVGQGRTTFELEPYTLLIYKKGLYLVGKSAHHDAIRTFALDGLRAVEWLKGEPFVYPADYRPSTLAAGSFGLFGGTPERIRIFFDSSVERFVRRRQWHPSQRIAKVAGGIELTMNVAPTVDVASWVLGFGDKAVLLEPTSLRQAIVAQLQRSAKRYAETVEN